MSNTRSHLWYYLLGLVLLLLLWQIASIFIHEIILASPIDTFLALFKLAGEERFWRASGITAQRMAYGILLGSAAGFVLGVAAGLNERVKYLLEPLRWMVMSISPVIVVMIAMLWFGMGTKMVIVIASILLSPLVYVSTIKGIEAVDEDLVEMARIYGLSFWRKLKHLYFPAITSHLAAAMTIVITASVRMVVLAEVLGTNSGVGYELSFARTDLNTPELFAWVAVTLGFVAIAEFAFLRPLESRLLRWKEA